ncbi:DUF5615 family PIN-like protein [Streptomyces sp. NPDC007162]|uniref:DUF5615 family PIN-like protein n=1 Tax=Streptomyces sp. NPDC007162 TaxID=3156917 RepID=UPI0033C9CD64
MKLLLDENVPRPMAEIVRILLKAHDVVHVHELKGWTGTKDIELYAKAKADGFEVVITNDTKQAGHSKWRPSRSRACIASSTARTTSMVAWWAWARRSPLSARPSLTPFPNSKQLTASVSSL